MVTFVMTEKQLFFLNMNHDICAKKYWFTTAFIICVVNSVNEDHVATEAFTKGMLSKVGDYCHNNMDQATCTWIYKYL